MCRNFSIIILCHFLNSLIAFSLPVFSDTNRLSTPFFHLSRVAIKMLLRHTKKHKNVIIKPVKGIFCREDTRIQILCQVSALETNRISLNTTYTRNVINFSMRNFLLNFSVTKISKLYNEKVNFLCQFPGESKILQKGKSRRKCEEPKWIHLETN